MAKARAAAAASSGPEDDEYDSAVLVLKPVDLTPAWLPHQWLFPFFDLFPEEDEVPRSLAAVLKAKLLRFFGGSSSSSEWRPVSAPRAEIGAAVLKPWRALVEVEPKRLARPVWAHGPTGLPNTDEKRASSVFTREDWAELCASGAEGLRTGVYADANCETVKTLLTWRSLLPNKALDLLLDQKFFAPLREWAHRTFSPLLQDHSSALCAAARQLKNLYTTELKPLLLGGGATSGVLEKLAEVLCLLEFFVLDRGSNGPSSWIKAQLLRDEEDGAHQPASDQQLRMAVFRELVGAGSTAAGSTASGSSVRQRTQDLIKRWREEEQQKKDELKFDHLREPEITMRQALEEGANKKGVLFQMRPGFLSEGGKQWYAIGKRFVYWEDDVCFVTDKLVGGGVGKPVSIQGLLGRV